MIQFHLAIVPPKATSQGAGKRIAIIRGKPMFFKNQKAKSAENDLTLLASRHAPEKPMEGPVNLMIHFTWPWRASESKKTRALGRIHHTSKPDCSNAVKMLEDVLTKLRFWNDDNQVASLQVSKYWGDEPGITVSIWNL
jgi:Holliday junction resolvase RusA-like endonuclease